jgi:orotate phosphoribosyltransferase
MNLQTLKEQYIHALYKEVALLIKEKKFTLHHGGESHIFINHSIFLTAYKNLNLLSNIYTELLPKNLKDYRLGVVDSNMSPIIVGLLSMKLEKDIVITKEKKKEHGIESKIYGKPEGEVVLIDDVTSTGSILINAANALREEGATVNYDIVSACRDMSAIENLQKVGIQTYYVATYEEVIKTLWDTISEKEKELIIKEAGEKRYQWDLSSLTSK